MAFFLITGGAGFIGRTLCRELRQAGHAVRVIDSIVSQAHENSDAIALPGGVELIRADLRNRRETRRALKGVDGVFHLAAEVGVGQSMYEVERYVGANDLGTAVLFQELLKNPVARVVVASSMSVYGEGLYLDGAGERVDTARRESGRPKNGGWEPAGRHGEALTPVATDEAKRPDLGSVYALSKYVQEQLVLILGRAYGIETVALRLFNVFGPGQALSNPYTGVLANFASRIHNGEPPMVFEDGRQRRDFVHVEDVARAFHLAMVEPAVKDEVVNIGSGRSHAIADVARLLCVAMGRPDLEPEIMHKARAGDIRHCFADIEKASRLLGYRPQNRLESRLHDLVLWVKGQPVGDRTREAHRELQERGLMA